MDPKSTKNGGKIEKMSSRGLGGKSDLAATLFWGGPGPFLEAFWVPFGAPLGPPWNSWGSEGSQFGEKTVRAQRYFSCFLGKCSDSRFGLLSGVFFIVLFDSRPSR